MPTATSNYDSHQLDSSGNAVRKRKHILLAVLGMTPQVITETIYALGSGQQWFADEVHIITTDKGAHEARLNLMDARNNRVADMCKDYGWPIPRCDDGTLHLIEDEQSNAQDDTRDANANNDAANVILRVTRELTADENNEIHFSIAGGRKTMTFLLGYCASLLARPQDSLSHVLVNDPFETNRNFYYPPRIPQLIPSRDNATIDTKDSRIALAPVPFIRLRGQMPDHLLHGRFSYVQTVKIVDSMLTDPRVTLRLTAADSQMGANNEVEIAGGFRFVLPPKSFALYWLLAKHKVSAATPSEVFLQDYWRVWAYLLGKSAKEDHLREERLDLEGKPGPQTRQRQSILKDPRHRLTSDLTRALGPWASAPYGIRKHTEPPYQGCYSLALPTSAIVFEGEQFLPPLGNLT